MRRQHKFYYLDETQVLIAVYGGLLMIVVKSKFFNAYKSAIAELEIILATVWQCIQKHFD